MRNLDKTDDPMHPEKNFDFVAASRARSTSPVPTVADLLDTALSGDFTVAMALVSRMYGAHQSREIEDVLRKHMR